MLTQILILSSSLAQQLFVIFCYLASSKTYWSAAFPFDDLIHICLKGPHESTLCLRNNWLKQALCSHHLIMWEHVSLQFSPKHTTELLSELSCDTMQPSNTPNKMSMYTFCLGATLVHRERHWFFFFFFLLAPEERGYSDGWLVLYLRLSF